MAGGTRPDRQPRLVSHHGGGMADPRSRGRTSSLRSGNRAYQGEASNACSSASATNSLTNASCTARSRILSAASAAACSSSRMSENASNSPSARESGSPPLPHAAGLEASAGTRHSGIRAGAAGGGRCSLTFESSLSGPGSGRRPSCPPADYQGSGRSPSPRWLNRKARALRQSRRTVRSVTFNTPAISSSLRPPK